MPLLCIMASLTADIFMRILSIGQAYMVGRIEVELAVVNNSAKERISDGLFERVSYLPMPCI